MEKSRPVCLQALTTEPQSLERLLLVTAFAVSAYSGVKRTQKPFNAFLGETCEFACPEKGFRFFAEKACGLTDSLMAWLSLKQCVTVSCPHSGL